MDKFIAWTEADKATVKEMREGGSSANEIAVVFKTTRNAVIGLCFRNGYDNPFKKIIKRRSRASKNPQSKRDPSDQVNRTVARRMRISGPNFIREVQVSEVETVTSTAEFDAAIPVEQRKSFRALKRGDCKWIVGDPRDPDFFYCGGAALHEKPYCAFHHRVSIRPPRDQSAGQVTRNSP